MNKTAVILIAMALASHSALASSLVYAYEIPNGKQPDSSHATMGCLKADEIIAAGGRLEFNQWYTGLAACKKFADDNGYPMLALQSNEGCAHCWWCDTSFLQQEFKDWATTHAAGQVIYCFIARGEKGTGAPDQNGSWADTWMWKGDKPGDKTISSFPVTVLWWEKKNVNIRQTGDSLCANANGTQPANFWTEKSYSARIENIIRNMENAFAGWTPVPPYAGGYFSQTNYPYASLQAEKTTTYVDVEIVRTSVLETNQTMTISAPGKDGASVRIDWAAGQLAQTNRIDNFDTRWFVENEDVTLELMDGAKVASTVKIACVPTVNSSTNPDFSGCEFGKWTMDLDAAKTLVGKTGNSYILVCVQGSQWCSDCGNVEKNFLDVMDGPVNKFRDWAAKKKIALVAIDIPNYKSADPDGLTTPCLLKKDAHMSHPEGDKIDRMHSGLGYLTRKMVSDADAAARLARNRTLVSTMTYEGGLNRPEERDYAGRAYRTGAPVFVLMDNTCDVKAHLVRMAEDSPKSAAEFDNYMKRFAEMIDIAENNPSEIENNYASKSGSVSFAANGGSEDARLCNADMYDTFLLAGVKGHARQIVTVKGNTNAVFESDCLVSAEFQKLENGKAVTIGNPVVGTLGDGLELDATFEEGGDYFVQVRGWGVDRSAGYDSKAFKLTSDKDLHFQNYTISGATLYVPGEGRGEAHPPAGKDIVKIQLVEGSVYKMDGMRSCGSLVPLEGAPAGFYRATAGGNVDLQVSAVNGTLIYQIWRTSDIGFDPVTSTVDDDVCDVQGGEPLKLRVRRTGGASGDIRVSVAVNEKETTLRPDEDQDPYVYRRYELKTTELVWKDGDAADKFVELKIIDLEGYYDPGKVVLDLKMEEQEFDCGIAADKGRYTLDVTTKDIKSPGKAMFTRADPSYVGNQRTIYVAEGDTGVVYAARYVSNDGLQSVILKSSVAAVKFAADDPFDLQTGEDGVPNHFFWASHEMTEKAIYVSGVPAGKTARITMTAYNKPGTPAREQFKVHASSNYVNVVGVAKDAPGFRNAEESLDFYRNVAEEAMPIALTGLTGGKVTFVRLAGTLPAGLKVAYDEADKVMVVTGVPTARAGSYEAVYQIREVRDGKTVVGLTTRLRFTIRDVTAPGPAGEEPLNAACSVSRSFASIPVYDEADMTGMRRLVGTLQMTIPPSGKISARFTGFAGTITFSSAGWDTCNDRDWTLGSTLSSKSGPYAIKLEASAEGGIGAAFYGGELEGLLASSDGMVWSKKNPATLWKNYYTVAMKHRQVKSEAAEGVAPRGDGYMTLRMTTTGACNSGTFTFAGKLPNGKSVSGSAVLMMDENVAYLPLFRTSSSDAFSAAVVIKADAQTQKNPRCIDMPREDESDESSAYWLEGLWRHKASAASKGSYEVTFMLRGSYYDRTEDLGGCCAESYGTTNMAFIAGAMPISALNPGTVIGGVVVEKDRIRVKDGSAYALKLQLTRSTGVVTGTFQDPDFGLRTVRYCGVVVNGWGADCCGRGSVFYLPFVNGFSYHTEAGLVKGGAVAVDATAEE